MSRRKKMKKKKMTMLLGALLMICVLVAGAVINRSRPSEYKGDSYVKLPDDYETLSVTNKINYEPTEEALGEYVDTQLTMFPVFEPDIAADMADTGNMVKIKYMAEYDGKTWDASEEYTYQIDSGEMFTELDTGIKGMKKGDSKDITVTLPAGYAQDIEEETLCIYHVTLLEIGKSTYYTMDTLTDEFAQEYYKKSKDELLADFKKRLEDSYNSRKSKDNEQLVLNQLLETSEVTIPQNLVNERLAEYDNFLSSRLKREGLSKKEYAQSAGFESIKDYETVLKKSIEDEVREELVLREVAKKNSISLTEEGFDAFVTDLITDTGYQSVDEYYEAVGTKEVARLLYYESEVLPVLTKGAIIIYEP